MKKLTTLFGFVVALMLLGGCAAGASSTNVPNASSAPPTKTVENVAALTTSAPSEITPLPASSATADALDDSPAVDNSPAVTDVPTDAVSATATVTTTKTVTETVTPTPTAPPRLPLRDDLPPMELQDFPRPQNDNGLGIHFIASGYFTDADLDKQIARIQDLHLKWATVVYADENQLQRAAPKFHDAGIMVVWRKTLRPYQRYNGWGRDIQILNQSGMPPYIQVYNEPELPAEWDDQDIDMNLYFANLLGAVKDVYNAGGYPGIQFLDEDDLRRFIDEIYARHGEALFHRMFFIPHAYGANHPPDYQEDANGVLGFRTFATIFYKRLGFIPPFIVGEGGWKIESQEDNRFPAIDDTLHRDYTLAVYDWFRTGKLGTLGRLPDYLFAFNMWMLSGGDEAGAWYDSFKGDRTLTIEAVKQIPPYVRKFSWDK